MGQTVGWALNANEHVFPNVPSSYDESRELLVRLPSESETDVPAMLLPPSHFGEDWYGPEISTGSKVATCVIYFHADACDIGDSLAEMEIICDEAFAGDAVILAPEYSGYGLFSEYEPSVESIDLVAQAAWSYCRKSRGFREEQIVLFGRSIGSGPASALAQLKAATGLEKSATTRPLGGVVLLAPFSSIHDVIVAHTNSLVASLVGPMWEVAELLRYPGLQDVPLCVVHPREDEIIPFSLGEAVLEGAAAATELKFGIWLSGETHNFTLQAENAAAIGTFLLQHMQYGKSGVLSIGSAATETRLHPPQASPHQEQRHP